MGDGYFLLTNLLSEDEKKVITSITAHIERGEKRVGIPADRQRELSLHHHDREDVQAVGLRRI